MNHKTLCLIPLFAFSAIHSARSQGGSLTPPGAPAPTMKSLDLIEPRTAINSTNTPGNGATVFKISAPGSYYLTGNVTGVAGKDGIEIASGGVTIDLNGFSLIGVASSVYGIRLASTAIAYPNICVRNGVVRGWGQGGIDLFGVSHGIVIEGILSSDNGNLGIRGHNSAIIRNCTAISNDAEGIVVNAGALIENCVAISNTGNGFTIGSGAVIRNCSAKSNGAIGIEAFNGATVLDCHVLSNVQKGISLPQGGAVRRCTAQANTLAGIDVNASGHVEGNTCISNLGDGISVNENALVIGNHCAGNGAGGYVGSGVHVFGSDNRIEANMLLNNDRGVDVDFTGNLILRNNAASNVSGNYEIVAGNRYGPIVDISIGGGAAVSGNSAASSLTSTDSSANFAH